MRIGPYTLTPLETGRFRLDGGAMFGSVPRALWSRLNPPDDANRIELALRCLYVEGMGRRIVIDTGIGDKWDPKHIEMFDIQPAPDGLQGALERIGVSAAQITDVILTHLHFDHAGGATVRAEDGALAPAFPYAMFHLQSKNLRTAQNPNEKERASYLSENFEPLLAADRLVLHDGPRDLFPGITLIPSQGHTVGLQLVRIQDGDAALYYCADLIPTSSHVHVPFVMGYDIHAVQSIEEKRSLLAPIAASGHWLFYEHDPKFSMSQVSFDGRKFSPSNAQESRA